jgi:hypothetical protein
VGVWVGGQGVVERGPRRSDDTYEPGHHKSVHYRALSEGLHREKVLIKQFN